MSAGVVVAAGAGDAVAGSPFVDAPGGAVSAADRAFDVAEYDVTMSYHPDSATLEGVTTISATADEALGRVALDLSGLTVRSVTVDSRVASFTQTDSADLVVVPATSIEAGDRFQVRVEYDGTPGAGWLPTVSGGATAFMGRSSAWFPAVEEAFDKASFRLTATVPTGWSVVSVGREGPVREGPDTTTFHWSEPAVDPAHLAVTVDRLTIDRTELADGTPVVTAYAPGLEAATRPLAARLPEILDFLAELFGPYPFDAAGNVFVHVNDDGPATAPQTRPVYLGAGNERFMNLEAVVHEQAHQWYGVSTAHRTSADLCLSECLAVYTTWLWDEAKDGADLDARHRDHIEANRDDDAFWAPLYRPGVGAGMNVYQKGPSAVHALRRQIGDEAFFAVLRRWPREHRGDHVEWPRFEAFVEEVAGRDLTAFFDDWFRGSTVPSEEHLGRGVAFR
ncbi:Aminopeptidase N [Actinoalloteichus hoggarensis]|uniref:Aminopeptidase N n=2 Tax=Actinoalloteichus hoggarensis TaxID=1470176 RepID=A0A221W6W5_9PSEU|nr:Aminopeptidase N [Actinoalloteichus hoggarensis]